MKDKVKAGPFDVADAVIQKAYPDIYGKGPGWWGAKRIPNWGILRGAIASTVTDSRQTEDALQAKVDAMQEVVKDAILHLKLSSHPHCRYAVKILQSNKFEPVYGYNQETTEATIKHDDFERLMEDSHD